MCQLSEGYLELDNLGSREACARGGRDAAWCCATHEADSRRWGIIWEVPYVIRYAPRLLRNLRFDDSYCTGTLRWNSGLLQRYNRVSSLGIDFTRRHWILPLQRLSNHMLLNLLGSMRRPSSSGGFAYAFSVGLSFPCFVGRRLYPGPFP